MRSELDVLLDKIDDPTLRADIRSQVRRIQSDLGAVRQVWPEAGAALWESRPMEKLEP